MAEVQKQFEITNPETGESNGLVASEEKKVVGKKFLPSLSPIRRHKSPEPKILEALDFFEAKCLVEDPPTLSVRFVKSNKVSIL